MANSKHVKNREIKDAGAASTIAYLMKAFSVPAALLFGYFIARVWNYQPIIEINGLSDFIRDLFLMAGCAVAYFMFLIHLSRDEKDTPVRGIRFWMLSCLFLMLILFDDVLMLHEQFGELFGVSDKVLLIAHGGLFAILLLIFRFRFQLPFWFFTGIFGLFSVVAIILDNTATYWQIAGRKIDLEQILEVFALLSLSSAFTAQALYELKRIYADQY